MPHAHRHRRRHAPDATPDGKDRRTSPRVPASAAPDLKARLLAGSDVRLVDISRRGVLLETDTRLLPGSPISVKFLTSDTALVMKGCVVRSSVTVVSADGVVYRTAVSFDEDIALCDATLWDEGEQEPDVSPDAMPGLRVVHSRDEPARAAEPPAAHYPTTLTTVFAASGNDLRALLVANDW